MVPIWSSASIGSLPLEKYPGWSNQIAAEIFKRTKGSGAECIAKKGGIGFAVGIAIRDVIQSVILDQSGCLRSVPCKTAVVMGFAMSLCRYPPSSGELEPSDESRSISGQKNFKA